MPSLRLWVGLNQFPFAHWNCVTFLIDLMCVNWSSIKCACSLWPCNISATSFINIHAAICLYMHVKLWEINQQSAVRFEIYVTHNSRDLLPEGLEFCLVLPCSPTNTKYSALVDVNDTLKGNSWTFLTFRRDTVFAWNLDSGSCQILSGMNQTWIKFEQRCSHAAVFPPQKYQRLLSNS